MQPFTAKKMPSELPLVTFFIVTYNQAQYIAEAVESALWQDYSPLHIVISDDASTDDTFDIVRRIVSKYNGPHRVSLNRNTTNLGLIRHASKVHRELAEGELLVGQGGDDISLPHRVRRIVETWEALGRPNCLFNSPVWRLERNGDKTLWIPPYVSLCYDDNAFARAQALYIGTSAAYTRSFIEDDGYIGESAAYEDLIWGFRAHLKRRLIYISEPLVVWRAYGGLSSTPKPFAELAQTWLAVYRERRADALRLGRQDLIEVIDHGIEDIQRRLAADVRSEGGGLAETIPREQPAPTSADVVEKAIHLTQIASLPAFVLPRLEGRQRVLLLGAEAALLAPALRQRNDIVEIEVLLPPDGSPPPAALSVAQCQQGWLEAPDMVRTQPDAVVCAGYLEASVDAAAQLAALRALLDEECELVFAFPNAASLEVIDRLADGRAVADTAERLYTPAAIQSLLEGAGFRIEAWFGVPSGVFARGDNKAQAYVERLSTNRVAVAVADESHRRLLESAYLVVQARPSEARALIASDPQELYALWIATHTPQGWVLDWMRARMRAFAPPPVVHLGIIAEDERINALIGTLAAMGEQMWEHWRVSIVARQPCPEPLKGFHPVVQWHQIPADAEAVAALSTLLVEEEADFVGQIEAGDRLAAHALYAFADKFALHPEWQAAYCDEDVLDAAGERYQPHFKADFDIDALRAAPFAIGGLWLMRRALFASLGGYQSEAAGVETYDLQLRAWEAVGDRGIGHLADVLYHRDAQGGHAIVPTDELRARLKRAVEEHLERCGLDAEVAPGELPGTLRLRYRWPDAPLVSICIPTRNRLDLLRRCIESLLAKTEYPNFEIVLVDNGSDAPEVFAYYAELERRLPGRFRWLRFDQPFNYATMMNLAAEAARGEYLLHLNNDIAVLEAGWLREMVSLARRPDVGVVGARLLLPDGRLQHVGVTLGLNNLAAEHPHTGEPADSTGYFGRIKYTHAVSAVTGACLLLRRALYLEVGGMDAERLKINFNDIDLCLKARAQGLKVLWTPHATLMHETSASLGRVEDEAQAVGRLNELLEANRAMFARWGTLLGQDPAYNRNLSLRREQAFQIEVAPALTWDPEWRPRPRVLAHPADRQGCGEYRIIAPMRALNRLGSIMGWETGGYLGPAELARMQPDAIVLQRQVTDEQVRLIERYRQFSQAFRVFEIDDLITNVPIKSPVKQKFVEQKDLYKRFRKAVGLCDRFVVSTEYLAEEYKHLGPPVVVVQNHLEGAVWLDLPQPKRREGKPRVGWAGASQHHGDLAILTEVIKATADEVDWVFLGMCLDEARPYVREFHPGVPIIEYPAKLASLDLDLAVAPLEDVPFNHAKSHLRLLEYGILGYPVVCTDLTPYRGDYPVTRVPNRFQAWREAILERVRDRDALRAEGDRLRDYIRREWILEDHPERWLRAWLPDST